MSDIEIARNTKLDKITLIGNELGIKEDVSEKVTFDPENWWR